MTTIILRTATRLLLPLLVLYSVYLLFQGHHHPGGGFIAGLMVAGAVALCGLSYDPETARRLLPLTPQRLAGLGLLTAILSGIPALLTNRSPFTAVWFSVELPGETHLEAGTPLLFDVGVFLLVVGVATMVLLALAEE